MEVVIVLGVVLVVLFIRARRRRPARRTADATEILAGLHELGGVGRYPRPGRRHDERVAVLAGIARWTRGVSLECMSCGRTWAALVRDEPDRGVLPAAVPMYCGKCEGVVRVG